MGMIIDLRGNKGHIKITTESGEEIKIRMKDGEGRAILYLEADRKVKIINVKNEEKNGNK